MTALTGITYTITNTSGGQVTGEGFDLAPGGVKSGLSYISTDALNALTSNLITITPSVPSLASAAGTASTTGAIADVTATFSQTIMNNNFATIVALVNAQAQMIQKMQSLVLNNRSYQ